jgi:hypothetical protein
MTPLQVAVAALEEINRISGPGCFPARVVSRDAIARIRELEAQAKCNARWNGNQCGLSAGHNGPHDDCRGSVCIWMDDAHGATPNTAQLPAAETCAECSCRLVPGHATWCSQEPKAYQPIAQPPAAEPGQCGATFHGLRCGLPLGHVGGCVYSESLPAQPPAAEHDAFLADVAERVAARPAWQRGAIDRPANVSVPPAADMSRPSTHPADVSKNEPESNTLPVPVAESEVKT